MKPEKTFLKNKVLTFFRNVTYMQHLKYNLFYIFVIKLKDFMLLNEIMVIAAIYLIQNVSHYAF